jgi:hypothetical protein
MRENRLHQVMLVASLVSFSWLAMMMVHECGHALAAICTGGHVQQMVWYPTVFSRTDVNPNPKPLVVVWAGPVFGAVVPSLLAVCIWATRASFAYLVTFFAGFCLLANGLYIGVGRFEGVGDARDMLRLGSWPWTLVGFGFLCTLGGFWLVNLASPQLGFGKHPRAIRPSHAYGMLAASLLLYIIGFAVGNRG